MFRISIFFWAGCDEAEELLRQIAELMDAHTADHPADGMVRYVASLAPFEEPEDTGEFRELVLEGAYQAIIGHAPRPEEPS